MTDLLLWRIGIDAPHVTAVVILAATVIIGTKKAGGVRSFIPVVMLGAGMHEVIFNLAWVAATWPGTWLDIFANNAGAFDAKAALYVAALGVGVMKMQDRLELNPVAWAPFVSVLLSWALIGMPASSPLPDGSGASYPASDAVALLELGYNLTFGVALVLSIKPEKKGRARSLSTRSTLAGRPFPRCLGRKP